eukprot:COSAG01_NODE_1160_length_11460_cov_196.773611_3_plen_122_part_00
MEDPKLTIWLLSIDLWVGERGHTCAYLTSPAAQRRLGWAVCGQLGWAVGCGLAKGAARMRIAAPQRTGWLNPASLLLLAAAAAAAGIFPVTKIRLIRLLWSGLLTKWVHSLLTGPPCPNFS